MIVKIEVTDPDFRGWLKDVLELRVPFKMISEQDEGDSNI